MYGSPVCGAAQPAEARQGKNMNKQIFLLASRLMYDEARRRQEAGELKAFIGTDGYLVLLLDKLERVMKGDRSQQTLLDVATDAMLALSFVVRDVSSEAAAELEAPDIENTHLTEEEVRELELQDFETEEEVESAQS